VHGEFELKKLVEVTVGAGGGRGTDAGEMDGRHEVVAEEWMGGKG